MNLIGATSGVAGHPLWHLAAVVVSPVAIIAGLKHRDRVRWERMQAKKAAASSGPSIVVPSPSATRARPTRLVVFMAAASAGAALIHAGVCPEHFHESAAFGVFFLIACIVQLVWSAQILRRPSAALMALGVAGNACLVLLWLYTRTIGLPIGPEAGRPETWGVLDVLASSLEVAVIVLALKGGRAPAASADRRAPAPAAR
ncbi:MAG: hypothetical protein ACRDGQ_11150 [Candidatus Limnocylindrales bacterium]